MDSLFFLPHGSLGEGGLTLWCSGTNQPKSILEYRNTNQKPAETDQKMKLPIDLDCEAGIRNGHSGRLLDVRLKTLVKRLPHLTKIVMIPLKLSGNFYL